MGFFDKLFDRRKKMKYSDICELLFTAILIKDVQFTNEFDDIADNEYHIDRLGVVAAYVDTKPRESYVVGSSLGLDMVSYGRSVLQEQIAEEYVSKCKEKHSVYSQFISTKLGNSLNSATMRALAAEVCRVHNLEFDINKIIAISNDIASAITYVDGVFSIYRVI